MDARANLSFLQACEDAKLKCLTPGSNNMEATSQEKSTIARGPHYALYLAIQEQYEYYDLSYFVARCICECVGNIRNSNEVDEKVEIECLPKPARVRISVDNDNVKFIEEGWEHQESGPIWNDITGIHTDIGWIMVFSTEDERVETMPHRRVFHLDSTKSNREIVNTEVENQDNEMAIAVLIEHLPLAVIKAGIPLRLPPVSSSTDLSIVFWPGDFPRSLPVIIKRALLLKYGLFSYATSKNRIQLSVPAITDMVAELVHLVFDGLAASDNDYHARFANERAFMKIMDKMQLSELTTYHYVINEIIARGRIEPKPGKN